MAQQNGVNGLKALDAALEKAGRAATSDELLLALQVGAVRIEAKAKEEAPVLSGNLRRSIHTEEAKISNNSAVVRIGTNVEYAPFVEFGTVKQNPNPFLRRAYDSEIADAKDDVVKALIKQLQGELK